MYIYIYMYRGPHFVNDGSRFQRPGGPHFVNAGSRFPATNLASPCASSAFSSSTSSDKEETHVQPAGLISDGQVSAASEGQKETADGVLDHPFSFSLLQKVSPKKENGRLRTPKIVQYKGNISDILAVMLYDFCNAFPTLLHE